MKRNLTMMTDLYQLTMMQGYFSEKNFEEEAVFDLFFRENGIINYALAAGLEQVVEYVEALHFEEDDLKYLGGLGLFTAEFLEYLRTFRFSGSMYAVPEGTVIFPQEPILIVKAKIIEAQFIETAILNIINHQTLIATKSSRIVEAAGKAAVIEFGVRRAQGPDAGIYGARASIIGGCVGTSNVLSAQMFGIAPKGTHSHSWVMSYESELEAFRAYARIYPDNCLLLVDTFDTLKSGMPNAIKVFDELKAAGHKPVGIRLDSGDFSYLSKRARAMLDAAGHPEATVFVSGDIDEYLITSLNVQGAKIDAYGVGTKLITSEDMPALGGVYKLAAIQKGEKLLPRMKFSDSPAKMTNPGFKELYRLYETDTGKAIADVIALRGETLTAPLTITHTLERWKQMTIESFTARKLQETVYENGRLVYKCPPLCDIAAYAKRELDTFWDEYRRSVNPHIYKVDLSDGLYFIREKMLATVKK